MPVALRDQSPQGLKCRALELLAVGVIPFENWAHVFANPAFQNFDGLRAKAFAVWFSTMADYLRGEGDWSALQVELNLRTEPYSDLFERLFELSRHYKGILSLYTIEDQIFLRDRRLQNVHGRLHIYTNDEHEIHVFDAARQEMTKVRRTAEEYRAIMTRYYPQLHAQSKLLLDRLLDSQQFLQLSSFYGAKLKSDTALIPLGQELGVGVVSA